MDAAQSLGGGVVVLVFVVVGFFLFRAVLLWYWKIDTQIELLREIVASLKRIEAAPVAASTSPEPLGGTTPRTPTPAGSEPATPAPGAAAARQRVSSAPRWE